MGFLGFFKKQKRDQKLENIFEKIDQNLLGKQMVNQAISFRNLKQYDKAISILKDAIRKYPVYTPARGILGTTFWQKGDIDNAEKQFKKILEDFSDGKDYPLAEIYANLGSLYYSKRGDKNEALKYYDLALKAPRAETVDEKTHKIIVSNVHRDLCKLYFTEANYDLALKFAIKRLEVVQDCPVAKTVVSTCTAVLNTYNSTTPDRRDDSTT